MVAAVKMQTVPALESRNSWANALARAVRFGEFSQVEEMLAGGFDINGATPVGTTLLMSAAAHGQVKLVRRLMDSGAAINVQRSDGFSALLFAVFFGHEDVVRELISRGADVKSESRGGTTAKMWARTRGFLDIEDLLEGAETPFVRPKEKPVQRVTLKLPNAEPVVEPQITEHKTQIPLREKAALPTAVAPPIPEAEYARRESALIDSAATPLCVANRNFDEAKRYSPTSALVERMSPKLRFALVVVVAMIGFGTLATVTLRNARTRSTITPPAAASTSSLPTVQEIAVPAQAPLVPVETEKPSAAAAEEPKQPALTENQPAAEKVTAQHSKAAVRPSTRNARFAKVNRAAQNDQAESDEKTAPAPVTFVTKPPQTRKTTPVEAPTAPAFPIEGTNKKKVIQWP
jgi:serine/threonine-protein phosphatase 6 regulatory ankyrin repeat subunit B